MPEYKIHIHYKSPKGKRCGFKIMFYRRHLEGLPFGIPSIGRIKQVVSKPRRVLSNLSNAVFLDYVNQSVKPYPLYALLLLFLFFRKTIFCLNRTKKLKQNTATESYNLFNKVYGMFFNGFSIFKMAEKSFNDKNKDCVPLMGL